MVQLVPGNQPPSGGSKESSDDRVDDFISWYTANGGWLHPNIYFSASNGNKDDEDSKDLSLYARNDIGGDSAVVSCPFGLAITLETSRDALRFYCSIGETQFSPRQRTCLYISLHWIYPEDGNEFHLWHRPYIHNLPSKEDLRTPLFFTDEELRAFEGTNLHGATLDQRSVWHSEWTELCNALRTPKPDLAARFEWDMYLVAATYLSSRAFPSTLLSPNPSLISSPSSYQVLLPGIDSLNHARAHPVTWEVTKSSTSNDLSITLKQLSRTPCGEQILNNYGPKPNASLILGYGFALEDNPDDTILLRIGGQAVDGAQAKGGMSHEIGRNAANAAALWSDVQRAILEAPPHQGEPGSGDECSNTDDAALAHDLEADLQTADILAEMVKDRLQRLPSLEGGKGNNMRPEVLTMWRRYVKGQVDILEDLLAWVDGKERDVLSRAEAAGVQLIFQEESEVDDKDE